MMTAISLRLPDSLHKLARELAEEEGISMNHLITLALAEKVTALKTESYIAARAARGDRERFEAALSKIADAEPPDERDKL